MKISILGNLYNTNHIRNQKQNNYNLKLPQLEQDVVCFNGLFTRKKEEAPQIEQGERVNLVKYEKTLIPEEGLSIYFSPIDKISTNSTWFKNMLAKVKNKQSLTLGRQLISPYNRTISSEHIVITKQGKNFYIEDRSLNGTTVFADSKYKNLDPNYLSQKYYSDNIDYVDYFEEKYSQIRKARYDYDKTFPLGPEIVQKAIDERDYKVDKVHQGIWIYRKFNNAKYENTNESERISLNVVAHPSIIYDLDNFFRTGQYFDENGLPQQINDMSTIKAYYKTPDNALDWLKRHDPITIYSCKKITDEFKNAIKAIAGNFKRENCSDIPLCGAIHGAPYMSWEKEAQEDDLNKLRLRALRCGNKKIEEAIDRYCYKLYSDGEKRFRASTGMLLSIEMIIDEYEEYLRTR